MDNEHQPAHQVEKDNPDPKQISLIVAASGLQHIGCIDIVRGMWYDKFKTPHSQIIFINPYVICFSLCYFAVCVASPELSIFISELFV